MSEDDIDILDDLIRDLRGQRPRDFDEQMKIKDRLLKAIGMKSRIGKKRRGKAFDLGIGSERNQ